MDASSALPEGGVQPSQGGRDSLLVKGVCGVNPLDFEVLSQLRKILNSSLFTSSKRHSQLLTFLVGHVLRGDTAELDEYFLAERVFNRASSFDASEDSIVRVEVGRLRRKLQLYSESEGADDPLVISLPPRSYVPVFRPKFPPAAAPAVLAPARSRMSAIAVWLASFLVLGSFVGYLALTARNTGFGKVPASINGPVSGVRQGPALLVLPFFDSNPASSAEADGERLAEGVFDYLEKSSTILLVPRLAALGFAGRRDAPRDIGKQLHVRLVLHGTVTRNTQNLLVHASLIAVEHGADVWSAVFERNIKEFPILQKELRDEVATAVQVSLRGLGP